MLVSRSRAALRQSVLLLAALQAMTPIWAQEPAAGPAPPLPTERAGMTIPALTPVLVKFDEEVSSEKNHRGDRVRISIAEDVLVDGHLVIPAGSAGEAEVIHVVPITTGGQPGELTLAARYVRTGEQVVRLRSLQASGSGKDRVGSAKAVGIAGSLVSPLLASIGSTIKGGAMVITVNTIAAAKTVSLVQLPASPAAPVRSPDAPSP